MSINSAAGVTVETHRIRNEDDLQALKTSWETVWHASRHRWPSNTWVWTASWRRNMRADRNLVVCEVRRDGRSIGFAAFSWHSSSLGRTRGVELAGSGLVDFNDFLCAAGEEEAATEAIARRFLADREWETVSLDRLPWTEERRQAWEKPFAETGHPVTVLPSLPTWQTSLPGRWEDFLAGLGRRWREHLRRVERRLQRHGGSVYHAGTVEEAREVLHRLFCLRTSTEETGVLAPDVEKHFRFHSDILGELMSRGLASVTGIKIEDTIVAAHYGFRYGDSFLYYLPGYGKAWKELSPGTVLLARCLESAIESGLATFDLGVGDEEYKRHWSVRQVPTWKILVQSRRMGARLRRGLDRCVRAGSRTLRMLRSFSGGDANAARSGHG
ncbi:MAG: GNAT family N-acetyltransferase [Gemmataceae bacterium]